MNYYVGKILTFGDGGGSIPIDNVDNLSMSSNEDIESGVWQGFLAHS